MFSVWLIGLVLYTAIDVLWLTVVAKGFMQQELATLLAENPKYWAAALFYLFHIAGLIVFVLQPYHDSIRSLAVYGAFFGFLVYAGFDFTCLAVFKDFTWRMAVVDLCWGATLNACMAVLIVKTCQLIGIGQF